MATNRITNLRWLHAQGALLPWRQVLSSRINWLRESQPHAIETPEVMKQLQAAAEDMKKRDVSTQVQLRWACSDSIGVPFEPFTVWTRPIKNQKLTSIDLQTVGRNLPFHLGTLGWNGETLLLGRLAAVVECDCLAIDPSQAVGMFGFHSEDTLNGMVGAAALHAVDGSTPVQLSLRCCGAQRLSWVNANVLRLRIAWVDEVVNADDWVPVERVGLPVEKTWTGTAYDGSKQGMMNDLTDGLKAALQRLDRGAPVAGCWPVTAKGRLAPIWQGPDNKLLIQEIQDKLLSQIASMYHPALRFDQQVAMTRNVPVDGPEQRGHQSSMNATAKVSPYQLLSLAIASDPYAALGAGFGTAYRIPMQDPVSTTAFIPMQLDYLITAPYLATPDRQEPTVIAAFVPCPQAHGELSAPIGLAAAQKGWVSPTARDASWAESVQLTWHRPEITAAMERATQGMLAVYPSASMTKAESLVPLRDSGGYSPLVVSANGAESSLGNDECVMVDAGASIAINSGGRKVGYAVALQDIFGVWSRWSDVPYQGTEPPPEAPRVLRLQLDSHYTGTTTCPAMFTSELSVAWEDRTPTAIKMAMVFFPMATAQSPIPVGVQPVGLAPAGCFRRDLTLLFAGDTILAQPNVRVIYLDASGEHAVAPGSAGQSSSARRYRVEVDVPSLNFSVTQRWGVQLWVSAQLLVGASPTQWSPDAAHPALCQSASPVPAVPLPLPQPPGVPTGSTLDAQGCSHVAVRWSVPGNPARIIIWEVAETALRQQAGLPIYPMNPTLLMGQRLAELYEAYDALAPTMRRAAFRRVCEVDLLANPDMRMCDLTLPKGTNDIHLYAVTAVTSTGVECPWPVGNDPSHPHLCLQAFAAPRLRQPSLPLVRTYLKADGHVHLEIESFSRIKVDHFNFFRTHSELAALRPQTMGPSFLTIPAVLTDPNLVNELGELKYSAAWDGSFPSDWRDWFVSAVAVPVEEVPVKAERGQLSEGSYPARLSVPPTMPPDLQALNVQVWGGDHKGILIQSSTDARAQSTQAGSYSLSAKIVVNGAVTPQFIPHVPIGSLLLGETQNIANPPAGINPMLVRGARLAGRTPLALWLKRSQAQDTLDITLTLTDPAGRQTSRQLVVPAWVDQPITLDVLSTNVIVGRGVSVQIRSNAELHAMPPFVLQVSAQAPIIIRPPPPITPLPPHAPFPNVQPVPLPSNLTLPIQPGIVTTPLVRQPNPALELINEPISAQSAGLLPRLITAQFELGAITQVGKFNAGSAIQALRTNDVSPYVYQILILLDKGNANFSLVQGVRVRAQASARWG